MGLLGLWIRWLTGEYNNVFLAICISVLEGEAAIFFVCH